MSQNDFSLANAAGATIRTDMNSAFQAAVSKSSGTGAPSTTYAFMDWADTTAGLLKMRDAANGTWRTVGSLGTGGFIPWSNGTGAISGFTITALGTATAATADYFAFSPAGTGTEKRAPFSALLTGSRILLSTLTASASATLAFTAFDSALYSGYEFEFNAIAPATDDAKFWARISLDAGSTYRSTAGDYHYGGALYTDTAATVALGSTASTEIILTGSGVNNGVGNASNEVLHGFAKLFSPDIGNGVFLQAETTWLSLSTNLYKLSVGGRFKGTTGAVNAIQFLMSAGNITSGSIRCYGVRK